MRILIILALLFGATSACARGGGNWTEARLRRALDDYRQGDYRAAMRGFDRLADHGSAIAETMLGLMYASGEGVAPRPAVAAAYFYRAANRGYGPAQLALSNAYASGNGIAADSQEAYFWALLAANGGDRTAETEARQRLAVLTPALTGQDRRAALHRVQRWRPRESQRR